MRSLILVLVLLAPGCCWPGIHDAALADAEANAELNWATADDPKLGTETRATGEVNAASWEVHAYAIGGDSPSKRARDVLGIEAE
jgi:hypothetical protein